MSLEQLKREHRRHERNLARVIASFFTGQSRRLSGELRDFKSITTSTVAQVFRPDDEHAKFMKLIRSPLATIMAQSATAEYRRLKPRKRRTTKQTLDAGLFDELPREYVDTIRTFFGELESQSYWRDIQDGTQTRLTDIVQNGLEAGDATPKIAKAMREWLGGNESKQRALAIARTETSAALNSGHYAVHQKLAADCVIDGRVWNSVIDKTTREDHVRMDGITVIATELFNVGGSRARFPGDWLLPAEQRVRCRCVVTATIE